MCRIKRFLTFTRLVMAASLLVAIVMWSLAPVHATPPKPSSPFVEGFVLETDDVYGYEILRPSSWTSIDLGDRRGYLPPGSAGQPNRIALAVTNLRTVSDASFGTNGLIANYELFLQDPSLSAWMEKTQVLWESNGTRYNLVRELTDARIYAVKPGPEEIQLIAYVVSDGQPLGVGMYGFGTFSNLQQLESTGLLADFETMVTSVSARQGSLASTALEATAPESTLLQIDSGPFHSDSGWRYIDSFTYRLQTDFYQGPPRVYWLYEYMYYPGYQNHTVCLYRTHVTDTPEITCGYGGGLLQHSIGKCTTPTSGVVTDFYYPNKIVDHLNTTTDHMEVFGDPLVTYCQWYFPFHY